MSRSVRMVGAVLIPAFTLPLAIANVARAAVPSPPTNSKLPQELDVASPYLPQSVCDPVAKPGVTAFARLVAANYNEFTYGISRGCNYGLTEHSEGRALDWMLNSYDRQEREVADSVLAWLLAPDSQGRPAAMARRFGIMYIIWDHKIWGTYQMDAGWRPYGGANPHTDHIHFSFSWDGAMQRTSWWTGKAWTGATTASGGPPAPITPPDSYPTLRQGASGEDVILAQRAIGVSADGLFGAGTMSALKAWQRTNGLSTDGVLGNATWQKLVQLGKVPARGDNGDGGGQSDHANPTIRRGSTGAAVKALQRILKISVDGVFGPATEKAVRDFRGEKRLRVNGVVTSNVWKALDGKSYDKDGKPATSSRSTLRQGSTGSLVEELQRILKISVDGDFGPATEKAVRDFQDRMQLRADGVVTSNVWKALDGKSYTKDSAASRRSTTAAPPKQKAASTAASVVKTDTEFTPLKSTVLAPGARNGAVKSVQRALGGVAVDGSYGSGTDKALRSFQRTKGLSATGVVDEATWDALEEEKYPFLKYRTMVLKPGSSGPAVTALQAYLNLPATGAYDAATEGAIKTLQGQHGLTRTGYVGSVTWQALEQEARDQR